MIKTIIIDDEQPARELIKVYLQEQHHINIIGEAENGFEGAKLINEKNPDLVFLDIQMPKVNGFEMLELLDFKPAIIFCTAYDQYAIKAFEENTIDYLLKPFSKSRFIAAIEKVYPLKSNNSSKSEIPNSVDYKKPLQRIVVKDRKEIIIIDVSDIHYLEAQDDYVEIHTSTGSWLKQQTMKHFEAALDAEHFVRVHRKYIIRIEAIAKLDKLGKESFLAILKSGASLPVSMSGYQKLKLQLGI